MHKLYNYSVSDVCGLSAPAHCILCCDSYHVNDDDRPCTQHAQAHAANEAYHAEDRTQMPADRNAREDILKATEY